MSDFFGLVLLALIIYACFKLSIILGIVVLLVIILGGID